MKLWVGFRVLLRIQADLNNTIVWICLIRPLISNSSSSLIKPLGTVPSAPITIGITVSLYANLTFAYYMIDHFISSPHSHLFAILLHLIYFCLNIVCPYGVFFCAAIRIYSVFLSRFPIISYVQVFSCKISLVCRSKISI